MVGRGDSAFGEENIKNNTEKEKKKKNFKNSVPTKYLNGWLMKGF